MYMYSVPYLFTTYIFGDLYQFPKTLSFTLNQVLLCQWLQDCLSVAALLNIVVFLPGFETFTSRHLDCVPFLNRYEALVTGMRRN